MLILSGLVALQAHATLIFGWAKPTPVNPMNLRYRQWGEAIVAAAGPLSNLVLAAIAALPLRFIIASHTDVRRHRVFHPPLTSSRSISS